MTQSELARRLGIHASYLSTIEHGAKSPANSAFLFSIASSLQLTVKETEELIAAAKISKRKINLPAGMSIAGYELAETLMKALESLNDDELQDIASLMEVVIRRAERTRHVMPTSTHSEGKESPM
ncbi:XRE family transcriptional regulator [Oxalobacteraceae bacterium CAVE-383]|nr:XRE family transcriptional regulator [Oxalobacteraceae bacterium CAVE-383]